MFSAQFNSEIHSELQRQQEVLWLQLDNVFTFDNGVEAATEQESSAPETGGVAPSQVGVLLNPIRNQMKRDLLDVIYLDVFNETIADPDDEKSQKRKSEEEVVVAVANYLHQRRQ